MADNNNTKDDLNKLSAVWNAAPSGIELDDKITIIENWSYEALKYLPPWIMPEAIESDGYYFVAYSRQDFKIVYADILRLESVGVDIWYDRSMEPGRGWQEIAERMMNRQECKGVIVYGTVNSMASEPVQTELLVADELGKNIIFINHGEDLKTTAAKDLYEKAKQAPGADCAREETTEEDCKRVERFEELLDRIGTADITYIDLANPAARKKELLDAIKTEEVLIYERNGGHASVVGVKYIGVRSIDIPEEICVSNEEFKVSSINACAFANCQNLEDVKVPRKLWSIGEHAFYNCRKLTTVHLGGYISEVAENAFVGCSALTRYEVDDIEIAGIRLSKFFSKDGVLYRQPKSTRITTIHQVPHKLTGSVVLPSGVSKIGEDAFSYCDITSITIPCSVVSIGEGAFRGCNLLESFMVESGNPAYHSAGKCIIETKTKTLVAGCGSSVIPDDGSVTSIGGFAFSYCDSLTSVTIPNTVTRIRAGAFHSCGGLVTVSIPSSVVDIGMFAFADCVSLANIYYAGTINQWIDLVGRGRHSSRFFLGSHGTVKCKDGEVPVTAEDRGE